MDNFKKTLVKLAASLELFLAGFILIAVLIGGITVVKYLILIFGTDIHDTYHVFKDFLAIALLLAIGVEFVLMLLSHSTSSILELVMFAIARKMLIYSQTMLDLLIGTAAILMIFVIRKYLMSAKYALKEGRVISAASPVHALNFDGQLNIPEDKGVTIGGLICHLSEETRVPVEEGAEYKIGHVALKILKMKDGLIEQVSIKDTQKKSHEA
jgi:hypothetical protein